MLGRMSLRQLLLLTAAVMLFLLLALCSVSFIALKQISGAANDMGQGKDVVADILPPPLYIIEAQLTVGDLLHGAPGDKPALLEKLKQLRSDYDTRNAYWEKAPVDSKLRDHLLGEQRKQADQFWKILDSEFLPALDGDNRGRLDESARKLRDAYLAHRSGVDTTVNVANAYAANTLQSLDDRASGATNLILLISLLGFGVAGFAIATLIRQINERVGGEPAKAMVIAQNIADGNLGDSGSNASKPRGILGALEHMRTGLRQLVAELGKDSQVLSQAAPRLLERAERAKASAANQSEATTEIAAAVEELSASIEQAADNAKHAHSEVAQAGERSRQGAQLANQAVERIRSVAETVRQTVSTVEELDRHSSEIGRIVQVIREIADQTNLLALNAAIEAARAGEQGRGFVVVADEVRKLAERTSLSTSEIASMITQIQSGMREVCQGIKGVAGGSAEAASAGEAAENNMGEVARAVASALVCVGDVAAALAEQNIAAVQVAQTVESIASQAEGTSRRATENADEARNLVQLSESLYAMTARFRY